MGKRHQQNPGKDFVKKKRRVGKGKVAPDNTTKTAFVTRGIVVPVQLSARNEVVPTSKRKLSFTELLSHLDHHNVKVRHDSLTGLRELFMSHPVTLTTNLSILLEKVSPLFTDSNNLVRQALLLLLKHIFENVKRNHLALFFSRIITCIKCAMTHIDNAIQLDSLKYLQLVLTDCSDLLIKYAPKVTNFYLNLLTLQSNVIDITKSDIRLGGNSKLVPMKTRLEIFKQLSVILKASIDDFIGESDGVVAKQTASCFDVVRRKAIISDHSSQHCSRFFDLSGSITCVKLVGSYGVCPSVNDHLKDTSSKKTEDVYYLLSSFTAKLLPILFECWMESGPMNALSGSFTYMELTVKMAVVNLLFHVVRLVHARFGENGISHLRDLYSGQFQKCFLAYFPFNNLLRSESVFKMNLYLCETTIILYNGFNKLSDSFITALLNFFSQTIPTESRLFAGNSNVLNECVLCFTRCLRNIMLVYSESSAPLTAILKGAINFCNSCHAHSQSKRHLIKFFYEVLVAKDNVNKSSESDFVLATLVPWFNELPLLLKELGNTNFETSSLIFEVLGHAAAKNMLPCISSLDKQAEQLFSEASFVSTLPEELQKKAVALVWHMPLLNSRTLKLMANLILGDALKLNAALYLIQIVNQRLQREFRSVRNGNLASTLYIASLYLSFMWSIITFGHLTSGPIATDSSDNTCKPVVMDAMSNDSAAKVQCVCKSVLASDFSDQVWDLVSSKLDCLKDYKCIPLSTALGILWFVTGINEVSPLMESSCCLSSVAALVLRLLGYVYSAESADVSLPKEVVLSLLCDIRNLLPTVLHNIATNHTTDNGVVPCVMMRLLKEPKLAHLFYKHRDLLTCATSSYKAMQWYSNLYKEASKFYHKQYTS